MLRLESGDIVGILLSFVVSFFCIVVIIYQSSLIGEIKKSGDNNLYESFTSTCIFTIICSILGFVFVYFTISDSESSLNLDFLGFSLPLTFAISIAQLVSGKIEKSLFEKRQRKKTDN